MAPAQGRGVAAPKKAPAPKKVQVVKALTAAAHVRLKQGLKGHAAPDLRAPLGDMDPASGQQVRGGRYDTQGLDLTWSRSV